MRLRSHSTWSPSQPRSACSRRSRRLGRCWPTGAEALCRRAYRRSATAAERCWGFGRL